MKYQPQLDRNRKPEGPLTWNREDMITAIKQAAGWVLHIPEGGSPHLQSVILAVEAYCYKRNLEPMLYWRPKDQCWTAVIGKTPHCGDSPAWALVRALYAAIVAERMARS